LVKNILMRSEKITWLENTVEKGSPSSVVYFIN
jgi:hypothetical protein